MNSFTKTVIAAAVAFIVAFVVSLTFDTEQGKLACLIVFVVLYTHLDLRGRITDLEEKLNAKGSVMSEAQVQAYLAKTQMILKDDDPR